MAALSKILRSLEGGYVAFWCPGCDGAHQVGVEPPASKVWAWDRNAERPTFSPSIVVRSGHYASYHVPGGSCWCTYREEHPEDPVSFRCGVCHSFVRDGQIQFLDDCTHALAGQTVPLPEWPGVSGS